MSKTVFEAHELAWIALASVSKEQEVGSTETKAGALARSVLILATYSQANALAFNKSYGEAVEPLALKDIADEAEQVGKLSLGQLTTAVQAVSYLRDYAVSTDGIDFAGSHIKAGINEITECVLRRASQEFRHIDAHGREPAKPANSQARALLQRVLDVATTEQLEWEDLDLLTEHISDFLVDKPAELVACPSCAGGSVTWSISCPICGHAGWVTRERSDQYRSDHGIKRSDQN